MGIKKLKRGLFISFEGPEGIGKSTQVEATAEALRGDGYTHVLTTREPGGTPLGKQLRELLLHSEEPIGRQAALMLFVADRAEHVEKLIRPALDEGQIVICDRYVDTTLAYQGWGMGHLADDLGELHRIATGDLMPDVTFLLQGNPHRERGDDRFERLEDNFHRRVMDCYKSLGRNAPYSRYKVIDANQPQIAITQEILNHLRIYLITRQ